MSKRLVYLFCLLLVLATAGSALGELVGHWKLDEGSGTKVVDSSGKGNDGTVTQQTHVDRRRPGVRPGVPWPGRLRRRRGLHHLPQ